MTTWEDDVAFLAREARARCGVAVGRIGESALEARLAPLARRAGFQGAADFLRALHGSRDDRLMAVAIEGLCAPDTAFFRDRALFTALRGAVLPDLAARAVRPAPLRIWSAGCATGQEAFSLAMTIEEMRDEGAAIDAEILATDLSSRALEKARAGLYSQFEVQRGLPIALLVKHFSQQGENWRASERLRARITFRRWNLIEESAVLGSFDLVVCREVLSALEPEAQAAVLDRIAERLAPCGYLALGPREGVFGLSSAFEKVSEGLFQRNAAWRKAA